jgi:hypothetical protein
LIDVTRLDQRIPLELALKRASQLTVNRSAASLSSAELSEFGVVVGVIARTVLLAPDEITRTLTEVECLSVAQQFVVWHAPQKDSIQ